MPMESGYSTMLGAKGLIRKTEFVRIIIQCLYSLGYEKSASCLESESSVSYKWKDFEVLESHILDANWEDSISTLNQIKGLTDEMRSSALFLVFKQCLFECLCHGDYSMALSLLQKQVSHLKVGREKVHGLAFDMLSAKVMGNDAINENGVSELRERLLVELERLLPPPIILPERRLEHLVETAVASQIDSCMYHNSMSAVSLYEDHSCDRDQIPTQTVQILFDHKNEVWFVQFSNNGEYLASSSSDCTAIIWKVLEDGKFTVKHTLSSHQKPVSFVAWSPDDKMLLTCGNVEVIKLWDVETGICRRTFGDHGFAISSCAWFPDSKRIVCGSSDPEKGICMWDCDGNEIRAWRGMRMPKVLDLAVTADGNNLITVLSDKEIRILNVVSNVERVISEEHSITSLSVSSDGKFFVVNLNSQEIHMWDVDGKWQKPMKYTGHKQHKYVIRSCFGGLSSTFIASGSENSEVYIWNRRCSEPIKILSGHSMTVNCVSWNPRKPQMLASASDDHTVRIWGPGRSQR
ncbi:hypothetical protein Nepgr_004380 [Nepenthes gracilis]|uniref:CTLH domain-containing protein n=1 Tax=Nepenthes gracilis TaxID=150966 RepID=A0AAD3S1L8_NEPGR|nr:hypothetical protein Nepgr_004380 [Nepenthes gracilis]